MRPILPWIAAGIFLGLSYLPTNSLLNCLIAWLATVFVCHLGLHKRKSSFLEWFCFGLALTATQFYWVPYIFQKYSQANLFFCLFFALLIWSLSALQFVLLGSLLKLCKQNALALILGWPLLELVFPKFIPWHLGCTQLYFTQLAQLADIGGPALVSLVMLWWASLL